MITTSLKACNQTKYLPRIKNKKKITANIKMCVLIGLCILLQDIMCRLIYTDHIFQFRLLNKGEVHFTTQYYQVTDGSPIFIRIISVGEMSCRQNVRVISEMSVGENPSAKSLSGKCLVGELSVGEMSVGEISLYQKKKHDFSCRSYPAIFFSLPSHFNC